MNLEASEKKLKKIICRICLKSYRRLLYLFEPEVTNMLKYCGLLNVVKGDGFPDKICQGCSDMLAQSYKLKQLCLHSESYLRSLVNNAIVDNVSKSGQNIASYSTLECEHLQLPEEESLECGSIQQISFLHTCSECQTCVSSQKLFSEHSCNISIDDHPPILLSTEFTTSNRLPQSEHDPESLGKIKADDKCNMAYLCSQCNIQFDHKEDVLVHQSVHSAKGPICNFCNKLFRTMKMLKRHIKIHMITKSHICKICYKGFSESTALVKHTKLHHLNLPRDKKYACDECGQRFTDKYYLNLHKRKHSGEKPFKCKICNKSYYDPRSYKIHLQVHKGTKPYLCSHCGKSFVQSAHLRQHLLVHTKEKPYSCTICNKRFTQSTSLQRHQKLKSGTFYCCICLKRFPNKQQFLNHQDHNNDDIETKYIEKRKGEY